MPIRDELTLVEITDEHTSERVLERTTNGVSYTPIATLTKAAQLHVVDPADPATVAYAQRGKRGSVLGPRQVLQVPAPPVPLVFTVTSSGADSQTHHAGETLTFTYVRQEGRSVEGVSIFLGETELAVTQVDGDTWRATAVATQSAGQVASFVAVGLGGTSSGQVSFDVGESSGIDSDLAAYYAAGEAEGGIVRTAQRSAFTSLFAALKAAQDDGPPLWDLLTCLWLPGWVDEATEGATANALEAALVNAVFPSEKSIPGSVYLSSLDAEGLYSPTLGFKGRGASQHSSSIITPYTLTSHVDRGLAITDMHLGVLGENWHRPTDGTNPRYTAIGLEITGTNFSLEVENAQLNGQLNSTGTNRSGIAVPRWACISLRPTGLGTFERRMQSGDGTPNTSTGSATRAGLGDLGAGEATRPFALTAKRGSSGTTALVPSLARHFLIHVGRGMTQLQFDAMRTAMLAFRTEMQASFTP